MSNLFHFFHSWSYYQYFYPKKSNGGVEGAVFKRVCRKCCAEEVFYHYDVNDKKEIK